MWSTLSLLLCLIIVSENYLENIQILLSTGSTSSSTNECGRCSGVMMAFAQDLYDSGINKRGKKKLNFYVKVKAFCADYYLKPVND